ncbi:hypothetical protein [uncultured Tessaracoccus sp.]|uniref:hypothetical protein n=1 Tax=uncultured Tessaracoccus sp. TaxID=905023 RepID=UPI0025FF9543|nr:hypothetical protein [uncultured Tessaracoccus sp.]
MRFLVAVLGFCAALITLLVVRGAAPTWNAVVAWCTVVVLALLSLRGAKGARRG